MRICIKHTLYIKKRWPNVSNENLHNLLTEFAFAHMPTKDFDIVQRRIQNTNSQCPICYYKKSGNSMLNLLVTKYSRFIDESGILHPF